MVYRDTRDGRIEQLKELIATESPLRLERAGVRREVDSTREAVDALARELEDDGLVNRFATWIGTTETVARRASHERLAARLATLLARERELDARLAAIDAARVELAEREAANLHAVRQMPGPLGDAMRALDRELAETSTLVAALEAVVRAAEAAETATLAMAKRPAEDQRPAVDRSLDELIRTLTGLLAEHSRWRDDAKLTRLRRNLVRADRNVPNATRTSHLVSSVLSHLGLDLRKLQHQRDVLITQQRALAEQAT